MRTSHYACTPFAWAWRRVVAFPLRLRVRRIQSSPAPDTEFISLQLTVRSHGSCFVLAIHSALSRPGDPVMEARHMASNLPISYRNRIRSGLILLPGPDFTPRYTAVSGTSAVDGDRVIPAPTPLDGFFGVYSGRASDKDKATLS